MEEMDGEADFNGTRLSNLKKSFRLAVRSLLLSCSKQEFSSAFSKFTSSEQEYLHKQFIKVITTLHENLENEFESICLETKVGVALNMVERLVEEQELDLLLLDKSNVKDVVQNISAAKKNELQCLMGMLEKAEEQNRHSEARIELLKKEKPDTSVSTDVVEKLKSLTSGYELFGLPQL